MSRTTGKLMIVGFGPGSFDHITERAREAIQEADVIIGYNTYVDLIRGLLTDQSIVRTGMTEEVSRAIEAVKQAEAGKKVAVISSGDAGVYGMAGLVYEVLVEKGWREGTGVAVEVIPGISAIQSCASLLGAPVMHDSCCISLSDHLTPWELIARRVTPLDKSVVGLTSTRKTLWRWIDVDFEQLGLLVCALFCIIWIFMRWRPTRKSVDQAQEWEV